MSQKSQIMRSAGAIVFTIKNGQILYLILKHVKTGIHWGFPKGGIKEGESEKEATLREVREETGMEKLIFLDGFKGKEKYSFERKSDGVIIDKTVSYFLTEADIGEVNLSVEHSEYIWATFKEAFLKLEKENLRELLKMADDKIESCKYFKHDL